MSLAARSSLYMGSNARLGTAEDYRFRSDDAVTQNRPGVGYASRYVEMFPLARILIADDRYILDVGILHKLIEHSKNRVGLLSLTLDTLAFAVYANLDVSLHDPLSDEHSCKVTARNTYDIALESQHKPSIEAVTMWLKTVYDKDFQKVRLTTGT